MSINIFYIPFISKGSTGNILKTATEKIKGPDYSNILYIAPTQRKIIESQKRFHEIAKGCYIPPEMVTFKQFSKRLYSLYEEKKVIPYSLVPVILSKLSAKGIGFASIIANFINEIKQYHTHKDIGTISNELKAIFHELGIPEEISARATEALVIFKDYQELLNKHSAVDENDVMAACPGLIRKHRYSHSTLILDGFYELTRSEEEIVKALIENANDVLILIPYDSKFTYITDSFINFIINYFQVEETFLMPDKKPMVPVYCSYPGIDEEVEGIARNIKNYFISGKITDLDRIIVSFPMLSKYIDKVSRIFRKYGIPYTTSTSKPAGKTRPFLDLLALLESIEEDYPRLSFSQCLISPFFKNMPSVFREYIPRICLRSGIIKGKDAWLTLSNTVNSITSAASSLTSNIGKELGWVFKKLAPLKAIKDEGSYSKYSECIYKLLNDLGFSDVSSQNRDIKDQVFEILKELSFIDNLTGYESYTTPLTLSQFIDALKHILNATETEIEGTGVQIMDFFEVEGIEPEYLFFGGLKDGDLPSKPDIDYLLPDSVRTRFGLVNMSKYLLLQKFAFCRLAESTKNIHLSYPEMEGDKLFLPSPFLPWNREVKEQVYGLFSKEEELIRKGSIPLSSYITDIRDIDKTFMKNNFGADSYIRVTDIDSYRACPRKFYIEKVLGLEPLEIKEYEIEVVLLGTIIHEIMQSLISMHSADIDDLRMNAKKILEKILYDKPLEDYWKKLIKDTFLSILPDIHKIEKKLMGEGYSFLNAEVSVEGEIIEGIKLRGKIDRVDKKTVSSMQSAVSSQEIDTVVELIDYKTGTKQFSGQRVRTRGATLQLFLYAALMESLGVKVERVGIYSLKDINLSWIPGRNDKRDGRTMNDYIEESLRFLKETVSHMRRGDFTASPLDEQTCRNCPERSYCPYIQKTASI